LKSGDIADPGFHKSCGARPTRKQENAEASTNTTRDCSRGINGERKRFLWIAVLGNERGLGGKRCLAVRFPGCPGQVPGKARQVERGRRRRPFVGPSKGVFATPGNFFSSTTSRQAPAPTVEQTAVRRNQARAVWARYNTEPGGRRPPIRKGEPLPRSGRGPPGDPRRGCAGVRRSGGSWRTASRAAWCFGLSFERKPTGCPNQRPAPRNFEASPAGSKRAFGRGLNGKTSGDRSEITRPSAEHPAPALALD